MASFEIEQRPQEGFNSIYTVLENVDYKNSLYNSGFQDKFFFRKKRPGLYTKSNGGPDGINRNPLSEETIDVISFNGCGFTGTEWFKMNKDDSTRQLRIYRSTGNEFGPRQAIGMISLQGSGSVSVGSDYLSPDSHFISVTGPGCSNSIDANSNPIRRGKVVEAKRTSDIEGPYIKIELGNSVPGGLFEFVPGSLIGQYVYIYSGPGQGQYRRIIQNSADTIYIEGDWNDLPTSSSLYSIYSDLVDSFIFFSNDRGYYRDGTDLIQFSPQFAKQVVSYESWRGRTRVANNNQIVFSALGDQLSFSVSDLGNPNTNIVTGTGLTDVVALRSYGDYLIVFTKTKILAVRELAFSKDDGTRIYSYYLDELTPNMNILNPEASFVFENGMYFYRNYELYAYTIKDSGQNDSQGYGEPMLGAIHDLIRKEFRDNDRVRVYIDDKYIRLTAPRDEETVELVYHKLYKGWSVNRFSVEIYRYKEVSNRRLVCSQRDVGEFRDDVYTDSYTPFNMIIEEIIGARDGEIWSTKSWKTIHLLMAKLPGLDNIKTTFKRMTTETLKEEEYDFKQMGYIKMYQDAINGGIPGFHTVPNIGICTLHLDKVSRIAYIRIESEYGDNGLYDTGFLYGGSYIFYVADHKKLGDKGNVF